VSAAREMLEMEARIGSKMASFYLAHGRDYAIGPNSFAGPREPAGKCYMNASLAVFNDDDLTYVEGKVFIHGVPIEHAWCATADGSVIDPTLTGSDDDGSFDYIKDYFGVPFRTDYVRKACLRNGYYGLLGIFNARKTLPKLVELGLEDGQQWLLSGGRKKKAKA
jgi:hypothetical protein